MDMNDTHRATDSAAAPVAGRTSGWVVVNADADGRDWTAATIHADYDDAVAERQEILGGYGEPVAAGRMSSADVPALAIRWAGSDGYLYIDRDISPDGPKFRVVANRHPVGSDGVIYDYDDATMYGQDAPPEFATLAEAETALWRYQTTGDWEDMPRPEYRVEALES